MAHPVITFPQPPPTSNTLTSHQRQQLLRSTRKLTKLLGSAPQLIDYDKSFPTVYLNLSSKLQLLSRSPSLSRRSYDTTRSPSPTSTRSSVSTATSRAHHRTRVSSLSENYTSQNALNSSSSKKRPPMLRLALPEDEFTPYVWPTAKPDTVSGTPPATVDADSSRISQVSDGDSTDLLLSPMDSPTTPTSPSSTRSYTLPIPRRGSIHSSCLDTCEPTFKVTSEACTRRLKMERIRKRLGECVPVAAVFPQESPDCGDDDGDWVEVAAEKKPARVNVNLRPRWKSSSAFVAFDVIYECPDEHGDEGLANGLSLPPRPPKNPTFTNSRSSCPTPPRRSGKLVKRSRREPCF